MNLCLTQAEGSAYMHKPFISVLMCILCFNYRERSPQTEQWVFGMVNISTRPATGYMQLVDRRNTASYTFAHYTTACTAWNSCTFR